MRSKRSEFGDFREMVANGGKSNVGTRGIPVVHSVEPIDRFGSEGDIQKFQSVRQQCPHWSARSQARLANSLKFQLYSPCARILFTSAVVEYPDTKGSANALPPQECISAVSGSTSML